MPRTLYLIDGHAQIYRAYYAPFGNLSAPSGEPTRATHVFCQMLLNLVRDRKPDYLAMVMDVADETTFRRQIYADYKAHRDPPPEDMSVQIDRIVSILEAIRVPILRRAGFEADDILATLARRHASDELHVVMVSRDKDLEQLLTPSVLLYDPGKDELITPERLLELKGWTPQQAVDAQTLIGDSVDNIPGVPGIGPKTAAKLIQQYGSARGVVENAEKLSPKQRQSVLDFAPRMELTRQLVTLRDDVPIELDLDAARVSDFAWQAARPIFEQLGFRRLPEQLPAGLPARDPADSNSASPADDATGSIASPEIRAASPRVAAAPRGAPPAECGDFTRLIQEGAAALRSPDPGAFELIDTPAALERVARELTQQPAYCVDTETTSVNPVDADLVGIALSWEVGRGCYIPVQSVFGQALTMDAVRPLLAPILADEGTTKVGHHLKYDMIVLRNAGLPIAGPLFDTMVAAFVLDPLRGSFKLDTIVQQLLGHTMIPITDLIGKGRDQLRMDQVPVSHVAEYASEDADYTWRLYRLFEPLLRDGEFAALFHETEMPLSSVLAAMELEGISIDVPYLQAMSQRLASRAGELQTQVYAAAGAQFNLDSPKQLADVLFEKLGFRVVKRTKTSRSTDAETLETLAGETGHPLFAPLLEFREIQKLRGTYVDALPAARAKRSGRIHTSFHQTGAITGRLSSSEPNLQNIPIRTELGREIRRAFIPRSPAERLIVADYSQVELRVLAHFCEDEALRRAFADDLDIHAFVAAEINGVPLADVTREMRSRAKAVNFGLIYGQTAFGLAQVTGMSRSEATQFIERYFARYPRIKRFIQKCCDAARRDGYVSTILGRRRPITDIDSRNPSARAQAERLAVNTVIQGSAADLIKIAMVRLHRQIIAQQLPLRLLLQVHDELVCEAPQEQAEAMAAVVVECMRTALPMSVPLKVDVATGMNWLEAK